jgi:hypothetical protein
MTVKRTVAATGYAEGCCAFKSSPGTVPRDTAIKISNEKQTVEKSRPTSFTFQKWSEEGQMACHRLVFWLRRWSLKVEYAIVVAEICLLWLTDTEVTITIDSGGEILTV